MPTIEELPLRVAVILKGQDVGLLGDRVAETDDPRTEPVSVPLLLYIAFEKVLNHVPDSDAPACAIVVRMVP